MGGDGEEDWRKTMERLTEWIGTGDSRKALARQDRRDVGDKDCIARLAAYEDTGMEPCDYAAMRAAMGQAEEARQQLSDVVKILGCSNIDHLRDIAQAEKDGRLVVLPCKDYCWRIRGDIILDIIRANCRAAHEKEAALKNREETDNEAD